MALLEEDAMVWHGLSGRTPASRLLRLDYHEPFDAPAWGLGVGERPIRLRGRRGSCAAILRRALARGVPTLRT